MTYPHDSNGQPGNPHPGGFQPGGSQPGGFQPGGYPAGGFQPGGYPAGGFEPPNGFQPAGPAPQQMFCTRHPDRATGLRCQRCGRPFCPDCLRPAAVGFQCVECAGATPSRQIAFNPNAARRADLPWATIGLIATNVIAFLVTVLAAGSVMDNDRSRLFTQMAFSEALAGNGYPWQFITSGFLHFGPIHLLVNMWSLWVLGSMLEPILGRLRFSALYAVSLLGGSALIGLTDSTGLHAGASGAIFGLFGAAAVVSTRLGGNTQAILALLAINLVMTFSIPNISWQGHIGGLIAGSAAAAAMVYTPGSGQRTSRLGWSTFALVGIVVAAAIGYYFGTASEYHGLFITDDGALMQAVLGGNR